MMKRFLECGKIVTTHGLKGEVKVLSWCDTPEELTDWEVLYLDKGNRELEIEYARVQKNMVVMKIAGIDNVDQALTLRNKILYLDRTMEDLEKGVYYIQDLMGLQVVDADNGKLYGTLVDVTETGANDVYHIKFEDGSIQLIPAIPQVIIKIDIEGERMEIRPLEGLFDDVTV
ncbi:MAG: ribosome maturation factor RimM [Angelakisella sp.]|nr:ribosome maturation factor RimM [Angelakisella sp.]